MYGCCQRRLQAATSETRQELYRERLQLLRDVMEACRSGNSSVGAAAAETAHNMSDLSPDPESPNADLSWMSFWTAVNVGQQIAALAEQAQTGTLDPITTSGSAHVDSVASALMNSPDFNNPNLEDAEEEEDPDSDECMETESQRLMRYNNSQMCEVSDIYEWIGIHHGNSEDEDTDAM